MNRIDRALAALSILSQKEFTAIFPNWREVADGLYKRGFTVEEAWMFFVFKYADSLPDEV